MDTKTFRSFLLGVAAIVLTSCADSYSVHVENASLAPIRVRLSDTKDYIAVQPERAVDLFLEGRESIFNMSMQRMGKPTEGFVFYDTDHWFRINHKFHLIVDVDDITVTGERNEFIGIVYLDNY